MSEEAPEKRRQQLTKNRANYKKWFSKETPEKTKERLAKKTASSKRRSSEQFNKMLIMFMIRKIVLLVIKRNQKEEKQSLYNGTNWL